MPFSTDTPLAIEIRGLKKSFREGRDQILRGVDLSIPKGKVTYLLGSSGSGKSVLLKHVLGLLVPDEGQILIQGQSIPYEDSKKLNELRRNFGMLFQNSALFDDFTVFENVAFPLVEHSSLSASEIREKVEDKLRAVGLDPLAVCEKLPGQISGGMKKRVALARAIALEPRIVLYDEPTTGLDPVTRNTVDELIVNTNSRFGLSSVIISHDMYSALNCADYIAFLHRGQIAFFGTAGDFDRCDHEMVRQFLVAEKAHVEKLARQERGQGS